MEGTQFIIKRYVIYNLLPDTLRDSGSCAKKKVATPLDRCVFDFSSALLLTKKKWQHWIVAFLTSGHTGTEGYQFSKNNFGVIFANNPT
jgi:hypothetical protein